MSKNSNNSQEISREEFLLWWVNPVTREVMASLALDLIKLDQVSNLNPATLEALHFRQGQVATLQQVTNKDRLAKGVCKNDNPA